MDKIEWETNNIQLAASKAKLIGFFSIYPDISTQDIVKLFPGSYIKDYTV